MKKYADLYQNVRHRDFNLNVPVLYLWNRKNKHQPIFDPHPYRVITKKGTMITAKSGDHQLTRNSKMFKIITKNCYQAAMKIVEKEKIKSTPIKFIIFPRQESTANEPTMNTPPQTPARTQSLIRLEAKKHQNIPTQEQITSPENLLNAPSNNKRTQANRPKTDLSQITVESITIARPLRSARVDYSHVPFNPKAQTKVQDPI